MLDSAIYVLVLALIVLLVGAAVTVTQSRRWARSATRWKIVDVSEMDIAPPAVLRPVITALGEMGFRRLGEAGRADLAPLVGPAQVWYFVDREGTTCAGVFSARGEAVAVIYTWFDDQAVVITGYPYGELIEEPDYRYHTITTSVAEAYQYHREQLLDFERRYGPPHRLDSMAEVLRLEALYNQRFAERRQRPAVRREMTTLAFQFYLILVVLGMIAALRTLNLPPLWVLGGAILLALPAVVLYLQARRRMRQR